MVNNGIKIDTKDLKGLENIKIPEINIDTINAKGLKKEMQQLEKDIAKGAKTIDGEYTNTLNGLRAKLRDLKADLGTLDLDVDADAFADLTDEISELNDKVKQMEQDYGTFSRNVGNYTDSMVDALNEFDGQMYETAGAVEEVKNGVESLKGKQLFDVNIGGQVVQFENISQAIGEIDDMAHRAAAQMMELKNAGKENTEEYKKLNAEFQEFVQKSAELEKARKYADELRDSMTSTTRGLDLGVQAFQALGNAMQMASGIAGLFGQNQEEIEKAINRTVQIMGIMQAAQELYQQTIQKGTVLNTLYSATFGKMNSGLTNLVGKLNLGTKAAKGLNAVLKVNIFVAIASAILYVVTNLDKLAETLGITSEETKVFTNLWEKVSPVIMGFGKVVTDFAINPLRTLIKTISKVIDGDFKGAWDELGKGFKEQFNVIEDYQKGYNQEIVRQQESATKKQKLELDKQLLNEIKYNEAKIGNDWKYTKEGIELYRKYFANKLSMYKQDSDEYQEALLEQLRFERELKEHQNGTSSNSGGTSKEDNRLAVQREIEDKLLSIMIDGNQKRMKELGIQRRRELEDAKKRYKDGEIALKEYKDLEAAIIAEYNDKEKQEMETHYVELNKLKEQLNSDMQDVDFDIQSGMFDNIIEQNYRDIDELEKQINDFHKVWETAFIGINEYAKIEIVADEDKQLKRLQKFFNKVSTSWKNMMANIRFKNSGDVLASDLQLSLKKIDELKTTIFGTSKLFKNLDKDIDKVKENLNNGLINEKQYKALIDELSNIKIKTRVDTNQAIKNIEKFYDEELSEIINKKNSELNSLEFQFENGEIDKDTFNEQYEYIKDFYDKQHKAAKDYYDGLISISKKYSGEQIGVIVNLTANRLQLEKVEYQKLLKSEDERYKGLWDLTLEAQKKELDNAELTEEQKQNIKEEYNKKFEQILEQHYSIVENLEVQHQNNLQRIEDDGNKERSNIISKYHDTVYKEYAKYYDKLEEMREKYSNVDDVNMGSQELSTMGSFTADILEMERFTKSFQEMKVNIQKQKDELVKQFNDGVIDEEAFNKSYDQLDLLEEETNQSLAELTKSWQDWSAQIANVASAVVGIWSQMFSQIADLQYQNEMYRIEQLQEQYDKETEILQDALEKQEELFEKHNQNVESIEGELETARGDRRLFLLDQINAEMMKREQAWAQQQKIAKQQEQLEKKKEALEQRQKAAEQKRNKQNQKVQIAQATASTALAVTNALSVQPWFLGVALAAVAAAMGAVQIATIAKQKFADGGVIQGASHANGGVKVLGGSAEVEGGEYITNKVTTSKNVDVLTFINSKKKKLDLSDFVEFYSTSKSYTKSPKTIFADGGQLPDMQAPMINVRDVINANNQDNRPIYVSVTEINDVQARVRRVQALAGLND